MPPVKQAAVKRRVGKRGRKIQLATMRAARGATSEAQEVLPTSPEASESPVTPITPCHPCASSLKLDRTPRPSIPAPSARLPRALVDLNCLLPLFSGIRCTQCHHGEMELIVKGDPLGFTVCLTLRCKSCFMEKPSIFTSDRLPDRSFSVNRHAVAASLAGGFGYSGLKHFSEFMNMPLISETSFHSHAEKIHFKTPHYKQDILQNSADIVKQSYIISNPALKDADIIDLTVSYDGSWHTRGHTSNHGVGCVIDSKTGLVLDYHVMCKFCKVCATEGERVRKESESAYAEWMLEHESKCDKNFSLSSGAMEVEAALVCWGRSLEKGFRYTNVISDGDCKTIKKINELQPYGSLEVQKEECINHVAKRLGKALRTLVDTKKKQGITLGGRGDGKLTQAKMDKFQKYYTKAIRSNDTLEGMRESVMATFLHCTSTDENPQHDSCPEGVDSWCFFQRAIAVGVSPPSHQLKLGSSLSPDVAKHVKEVFERMSSDDLLKRCLAGKTQNANESLHGLLWSRCPKHIFVHRNRLETSIALAVGEFNEGSTASRCFMDMHGLDTGALSVKHGLRRDRRRAYFGEYSESEKNKQRKKKREEAKKKEFAETINKEKAREGGLLYEAGGDD